MTNAEISRAWFQRVWNEQDASAIDEHLHKDVAMYGIGPAPLGREGFRQIHTYLLKMIPDLSIEVQQTVEEGEWVALRATAAGTHKETQKPISFQGLSMARIVDGKAVETQECWDFLSLLVQTGAVSEKTANVFG